jgi:3-deoxy-D-arabino-heptulosonate 7-phosphate (DAHP) synthase class II
VRAKVEAFFDVHDAMGSVPGGVHLEMTGAAVVCFWLDKSRAEAVCVWHVHLAGGVHLEMTGAGLLHQGF